MKLLDMDKMNDMGQCLTGRLLTALLALLYAGCTVDRIPEEVCTRGFGTPERLEIWTAVKEAGSAAATAAPCVRTSVGVRSGQDTDGIYRVAVTRRSAYAAADIGADAGTVPKGVWVMDGNSDTLSLRLRHTCRQDGTDHMENGETVTKSVIYEEVPPFSLWRAGYMEGSSGIIDIDGDRVERDGDTWLTAGRYRADAVPDGGRMRYMALAPADASGLTPDIESLRRGELKVSVMLESQAAAVDWLAGASTAYASAPSRPELSLRHIMAQVRVVSTLAVDWTVERVEFTGVYRSGTWMESGWTSQGSAGDYGVDVSADLSGGPAVIADGTSSLLCIPQSCPEGAKLRIKARHRTASDIVRWLEADIAGDVWEEGRTATYELTPLSLGYSISLSNGGRIMAHQEDKYGNRWFKYLYLLTNDSGRYDQDGITGWANDGDVNLITVTPPQSVSGQALSVTSGSNAVCRLATVPLVLVSSDGWHEVYKVQLNPVARGNCTIDVSYGTESASFACQVAASPTVEMDGPGYYIGNTSDYINVRYSYDTDIDGNLVVEDPSLPVSYVSADPSMLTVDENWYDGFNDRIWISTHEIDYDYVTVDYNILLTVTMTGVALDPCACVHQVKPLPLAGTCTEGDYIVTEGHCSESSEVTCDNEDFSFFNPGRKVNIWYNPVPGVTEAVELRVNCCIGLIWRNWEGGGQTRGLNIISAVLERNDGTDQNPSWTYLSEENGDLIWAGMTYYDIPVVYMKYGLDLDGVYRLRCTSTGSDSSGAVKEIFIPVDLV